MVLSKTAWIKLLFRIPIVLLTASLAADPAMASAYVVPAPLVVKMNSQSLFAQEALSGSPVESYAPSLEGIAVGVQLRTAIHQLHDTFRLNIGAIRSIPTMIRSFVSTYRLESRMVSSIRRLAERPLQTVYYPGCGTNIRRLLKIAPQVETIVGVDPFRSELSNDDIVHWLQLECDALHLAVQVTYGRVQLPGASHMVTRFEARSVDNQKPFVFILYRGNADVLTPNMLPETKKAGIDMYYTQAAMFPNSLKHSIPLLHEGGVLVVDDMEGEGRSWGHLADAHLDVRKDLSEKTEIFERLDGNHYFLWRKGPPALDRLYNRLRDQALAPLRDLPTFSFSAALNRFRMESTAKNTLYEIKGPIFARDLHHMIGLPVEVGLCRIRGTDRWIAVKGTAHNVDTTVVGPLHLFDLFIHNHPREPSDPLPSGGDLATHFVYGLGATTRCLIVGGAGINDFNGLHMKFPTGMTGEPEYTLTGLDEQGQMDRLITEIHKRAAAHGIVFEHIDQTSKPIVRGYLQELGLEEHHYRWDAPLDPLFDPIDLRLSAMANSENKRIRYQVLNLLNSHETDVDCAKAIARFAQDPDKELQGKALYKLTYHSYLSPAVLDARRSALNAFKRSPFDSVRERATAFISHYKEVQRSRTHERNLDTAG